MDWPSKESEWRGKAGHFNGWRESGPHLERGRLFALPIRHGESGRPLIYTLQMTTENSAIIMTNERRVCGMERGGKAGGNVNSHGPKKGISRSWRRRGRGPG